jgi:acetyltransferase
MPTTNLDRLFRPRGIAVIGAGCSPTNLGRLVLENLQNGGFEGTLFPVNPKHEQVAGRPCFARVALLPEPMDLAVICTPAATVPQLVRECGERQIAGVVILSAGFREEGAAGRELESQIQQEASHFPKMRILGPNCLGFISPHRKLNASFAGAMPAAGGITFLSQSGALCTAVLDWAAQEGIGFANFVSTGNSLDVSIADLIDHFADDPHTTSLILYVESIPQARQFMSAARACSRNKPIIAYKAGRFAESAQAAASHTGAMAGVDAVYDAAFRRAGVVRVSSMDDMFDTAELLSRCRVPHGSRLAIVTNAGGPGVMAADALLERKGTLAPLAADTVAKLDTLLPPSWSHQNPVDILGDAGPERLGIAVQTVLADPGIDAALVICTPQAMTHPQQAAQATIEAARSAHKPVLASWIGGRTMSPAIAALNAAGIPTYFTPEDAVRAFSYLVSYKDGQDVLHETPRDLSLDRSRHCDELRQKFRSCVESAHHCLDEVESKELLREYEIPVVATHLASSRDQAVEVAEEIGYPVVLKLHSPDITHKTDVHGVELNLANADAVREAFDRITGSARALRPTAQIKGVAVERMVKEPTGVELIVGARRDPVFGPVLLLGAGGVTAELMEDRSLELPPLNERLARGMVDRLRIAPLLKGYRGRSPLDVEGLITALIHISQLVSDCPEISELDVNPLLVTPDGVTALDARVILDPVQVHDPAERYSHLAIRPYPGELIRSMRLKDGTPVTLRPIRPEDEPLWRRLLANCSPASIHQRFRGMVKPSHETAARYCFIDYDREMAIVAQVQGADGPELVGVGRLAAEADRQSAECAFLVTDGWQRRGIGTQLLDVCLQVARGWGCRTIWAQTSSDNCPMLKVFGARGFDVQHGNDWGTVTCRKSLEDSRVTAP